ncbi:hypothetical protein K469DRAFT_681861 [Zopfia rhizophila CBS 207.26]|uniref:Uncharacterized protein n=1 Tax=Zopfia rhizophila CBS 207.26 TaxID=1314779 RepID=A0A6A6EXN0_9PEZI|nr:hypothetical protein K469DRAFT_681861 [Zopfia rhizophila CBS 207.26]
MDTFKQRSQLDAEGNNAPEAPRSTARFLKGRTYSNHRYYKRLSPGARLSYIQLVDARQMASSSKGSKTQILQPYEALSYHWGTGDAEHPIWVQDAFTGQTMRQFQDVVSLKMKRLYVGSNLYKAFKSLRRKDAVVYL